MPPNPARAARPRKAAAKRPDARKAAKPGKAGAKAPARRPARPAPARKKGKPAANPLAKPAQPAKAARRQAARPAKREAARPPMPPPAHDGMSLPLHRPHQGLPPLHARVPLRRVKEAEHAHRDPRFAQAKPDLKWMRAHNDPRKSFKMAKDRMVPRMKPMVNWYRKAPKAKGGR